MIDTFTETFTQALDPGRRIYVQEQAVVRDGMVSEDRFKKMIYCAASLTIPRVYAHAESELEIWEGRAPRLSADKLVSDLGYRALQSLFFRQIVIKDPNLTSETKMMPLLHDDEQIAANCYFSNYYTLATSETAAERMFSDTSTISAIKDLPPEGLTLISSKNLKKRLKASDYEPWIENVDIRRATTQFTDRALEHLRANNNAEDIDPLSIALVGASDRLSIRLNGLVQSITNDLSK